MTADRAFLTRLVDLEDIRELARRYSRGLDREDLELLKSVYWEDATDDHGSLFVGNGWEFAEYALSRRTRVRPTMHCIFNHSIDIDSSGAVATGEVYSVGYQFRHSSAPPVTRAILGRYLDRYEKRSSEWRIIDRVYVFEGQLRGDRPLDSAAALPPGPR